jgi:hypothetical protein
MAYEMLHYEAEGVIDPRDLPGELADRWFWEEQQLQKRLRSQIQRVMALVADEQRALAESQVRVKALRPLELGSADIWLARMRCHFARLAAGEKPNVAEEYDEVMRAWRGMYGIGGEGEQPGNRGDLKK